MLALGCRGVSCRGFPLRRPHRGRWASPEADPRNPVETARHRIADTTLARSGCEPGIGWARAMDGEGRLARSLRSL